jgi:hypothetical protein
MIPSPSRQPRAPDRHDFGTQERRCINEGRVLRAEVVSFRSEVAANFEELRTEMRAEIRAGDEETRRQMRVLHEDVISRIALLSEGKHGKRPVR